MSSNLFLLDVAAVRPWLPIFRRRATRARDTVFLATLEWTDVLLRVLGDDEPDVDARVAALRRSSLVAPAQGEVETSLLWLALDVDLVMGRPREALATAARFVSAGTMWSILSWVRQAMAAISCAREGGPDARALIRLARRRLRHQVLARQALEPPLIRGALARYAGDFPREVRALRAFLEAAARDPLCMDRSATVAGARWRLGQLVGGREGAEQQRTADAIYERLGIRHPEKARRLWNWD